MRASTRLWLTLGGYWWLAGVAAQEAEQEPAPDLDFLEYLGAWAGEDDEWHAIEEWRKDNPDDEDNADEGEAERKDEDDASE